MRQLQSSPAHVLRASSTALVLTRHGTGSLGHRVNGSFGSSFTSGSQGHRIIILTRCESRVFPVFENEPKMQHVHLKCGYKYSHLLTYFLCSRRCRQSSHARCFCVTTQQQQHLAAGSDAEPRHLRRRRRRRRRRRGGVWSQVAGVELSCDER